MTALDEILADASRYDLHPASRYEPPFPLRAYGTISHDRTIPCCAMETICIALGDAPSGVHREVNPFISALIRIINDRTPHESERTRTLWPYLPLAIGTGHRLHDWERDLYVMILDRPLTVIEDAALWDLDAEKISYAISQDLDNRRLTPVKLTDLLRWGLRTYWDSHPDGASRQTDWTPQQYFRIRQYATGLWLT